jgi:uncharacterized protein
MLTFCVTVSAQNRHIFPTDHQHHIERLNSSKDSLYQQTLNGYDKYIASHPSDFKVQLERCRFIEKAYYDSYEDYNPNYEESMACAGSLLERFPETPEVMLYPTELLYADTLIAYLHTLEDSIGGNPTGWKDHDWQVYQLLAEQYGYDKNNNETIRYGNLALSENDTLDLSLTMGRAYLEREDKFSAIDVLVSNLDSTDSPWELSQKAELLLQLGVSDKAIDAFKMASRKEDFRQDAGSMAKAMIDNGLIAEARPYLLKEFESSGEWNRTKATNALFLYDLKYGDADSARVSYKRMTETNFKADAFGIYRLRLFAKAPLLSWTFSDGGRVALMLLLFAAVLIVPYLWVLPLHYRWSLLQE